MTRRETPVSGGQTAYLDMANWIDLAEGHVDPRAFEDAIERRLIVPVLSLTHLLELASNDDRRGRERVARYMDSIDSLGQVRWIKHYRDVMRSEAIACFKEVYGSTWEPSVVFFDSFHDTLPNLDPSMIMMVGQGIPRHIFDTVEFLKRLDEFREYLRDCVDYPDVRRGIAAARAARGAKGRFTKPELVAPLADLLPDQVPTSFGSVVLTDDLAARFLKRADLGRCPAFRAHWAFYEGANLDPGSASRSDLPDLWHLPGTAYCDVAFVDKRTAEALRKGNWEETPKRNSELPKWLDALT